jgi:hypothetical protein
MHVPETHDLPVSHEVPLQQGKNGWPQIPWEHSDDATHALDEGLV